LQHPVQAAIYAHRPSGSLSKKEKAELGAIEDRLPIQALIIYRQLAVKEYVAQSVGKLAEKKRQKDEKQAARAKNSSRRGFWCCGSKSAVDDASISTSEMLNASSESYATYSEEQVPPIREILKTSDTSKILQQQGSIYAENMTRAISSRFGNKEAHHGSFRSDISNSGEDLSLEALAHGLHEDLSKTVEAANNDSEDVMLFRFTLHFSTSVVMCITPGTPSVSLDLAFTTSMALHSASHIDVHFVLNDLLVQERGMLSHHPNMVSFLDTPQPFHTPEVILDRCRLFNHNRIREHDPVRVLMSYEFKNKQSRFYLKCDPLEIFGSMMVIARLFALFVEPYSIAKKGLFAMKTAKYASLAPSMKVLISQQSSVSETASVASVSSVASAELTNSKKAIGSPRKTSKDGQPKAVSELMQKVLDILGSNFIGEHLDVYCDIASVKVIVPDDHTKYEGYMIVEIGDTIAKGSIVNMSAVNLTLEVTGFTTVWDAMYALTCCTLVLHYLTKTMYARSF
jgi:hypothetical protein